MCACLLRGRLQRLEQVDGGLGRQVFVVVVVDLDHGRVGARAETFDFGEGEEAVGGRLAVVDAEVGGDGFHDGVGVAELAGSLGFGGVVLALSCLMFAKEVGKAYSGTALDMEFAHRTPVVHGVEGGDFVHAHRWHLEDPSHFVHDADTGEAVLSLS